MHEVIRAEDPYSIHTFRYQEDNLLKKGPTSDNRSDHSPIRCLDPHSVADVGEYFGMAHRHQT